MTTTQIPLYADQRFSAFPDADFLPEAVRDDVAKLMELRTKALDAREAAHEAQANIDIVNADAIKDAADKLASGEDAEPDAKKVDAAVRKFEQAVRTLKATEQAITQVESRLMVLFKANVDESHELAAGLVDEARAGYVEALARLDEARVAYYRAASIEQFSHAFDGGQPPKMVGYTQRMPDDGPMRLLRAELERELIDTQGGPGLNARPHARPAPQPPSSSDVRYH